VGAPPDDFNNRGQNWGLPPFDPARVRATNFQPFIETIRASMADGGGVRIDHVMGLFRLWWIPEGSDATGGAYVRYPADDLLAIVALESTRARAFVVGEDLGTVEDSARAALAAHDVLSYKLLWFEDQEPPQWPRHALAAITTHDLPTVVGLWSRRDIAAQRAAGLDPSEAKEESVRERLAARGHLDADASADAAVIAAHELLGRAPSMLLTATLDDAVGEPERPNIPGADGQRPNWSLALPTPLEEIETHPLAERIARILTDSIEGRSDERHG
jgi:4-alpha-glucanotransferase